MCSKLFSLPYSFTFFPQENRRNFSKFSVGKILLEPKKNRSEKTHVKSHFPLNSISIAAHITSAKRHHVSKMVEENIFIDA